MKNLIRFFAAITGICLLAFSFSSCEKESLTTNEEPTLRTLDEIVQVVDADKTSFYEYSVSGAEMMNILGDDVDPNLPLNDIARQFAKLVQETYFAKTDQKLSTEQKSRAAMPIYNHRMTTIRFNTTTGTSTIDLIGVRGFISSLFTPAFDDRASRNYFPFSNVLVTTFTDINDQNGPVSGLGASDSTFDKTCINGPGPISINNAKYWRVRNRVVWTGSAFTTTSAVITCGRIRTVAFELADG